MLKQYSAFFSKLKWLNPWALLVLVFVIKGSTFFALCGVETLIVVTNSTILFLLIEVAGTQKEIIDKGCGNMHAVQTLAYCLTSIATGGARERDMELGKLQLCFLETHVL